MRGDSLVIQHAGFVPTMLKHPTQRSIHMALADPQSVTISGTAVSLPRTSAGTNAGVFTSADQNTKLSVSHTYGKRNRHLVRLDTQKIAADPLMAGINAISTMSAYLVVDVPKSGYDQTAQKGVVDALVAALAASSGGLVTKVLGGEM
jgi:hypothetical protein